MEVYFKDLISKETSLEKLVDDLALVVHGANDFAEAVGANISEQSRKEMMTRLERLKDSCGQLGTHAASGLRAADKIVRQHPYASVGIACLAGLLTAIALRTGRDSKDAA